MSVPLGSRLLPAWNPLMTAVRFRTRKPNLKRPAIPHWTRAVVLKLVKPVHKDPMEGIHPRETCAKRTKALQSKTEQASIVVLIAHGVIKVYYSWDNSYHIMGRAFEVMKVDICYNKLNVVIGGTLHNQHCLVIE